MAVAGALRTLVAAGVSGVVTGLSLLLVGWLGRPAPPSPPVVRPVPPPIELAAAPEAEPPPDPMPSTASSTEPAPSPTPPEAIARPAVDPGTLAEAGLDAAGLDGLAILPPLGTGLEALGPAPAPARAPQAAPETPARPMRRPSPRYPPQARRDGIEGFVTVRMRVDARGRVKDVVVVRAEPPGVFEDVARDAAKRYRFQPARRGGEPVETTIEQRIVFRIQ